MSAPPVTLHSPAELLAVIPHLLGFEPARAIVVMALRGNRLGLTQRMDLPDPERVEAVADALVGHLLRDAATGVLLVGYEQTRGESLPLIDALTRRLHAAGVSSRDRIVVHDRRWRSLDCDRPTCCPADGTPLPAPDRVASAVAEFIGRGSAPLPDRQSLAEQVEPTTRASVVAELLRRGSSAPPTRSTAGPCQRPLAEVWARVLQVDGPAISTSDAALALQSLGDVTTRDGLACLLIPNSLDDDVLPENIQTLVRQITASRAAQGHGSAEATPDAVKARLVALCQHATDEHAAPALTLLATYSWWHGDGALARVAIDRALRCDPGYRLARLLELMLDEGIRPDRP